METALGLALNTNQSTALAAARARIAPGCVRLIDFVYLRLIDFVYLRLIVFVYLRRIDFGRHWKAIAAARARIAPGYLLYSRHRS